MNRKIFLIFSLFMIISLTPLFSQQDDNSGPGSKSAEAFAIIPNLEPEESSDIDISRTKSIFKTNVKSCKIYLNGNFQGISNLTLTNLIEGFYLMRVEKEGYISQENFVYIERGKEKSFFIELQPKEKKQDEKTSAESEKSDTNETPESAETPAGAEG